MDAASEFAFSALSWRDAAALVLFAVCVAGLTALIERPRADRLSVGRLMAQHRERWMGEMAERDVRIMDAALLNIQHQGAGFFASASMIAIGGVFALIGSAETLLAVAGDLAAGQANRAVWELKLLFLLVLMVLALLSFIWSQRLFGYCAVLIGAVPPVGEDNNRHAIAAQAAIVNIRAGRSFNRGLRLVYFALASLAWLLGPEAFAFATLATTAMIYRREYRSATHEALAAPAPDAAEARDRR